MVEIYEQLFSHVNQIEEQEDRELQARIDRVLAKFSSKEEAD